MHWFLFAVVALLCCCCRRRPPPHASYAAAHLSASSSTRVMLTQRKTFSLSYILPDLMDFLELDFFSFRTL
jgi:hypothetical protein